MRILIVNNGCRIGGTSSLAMNLSTYFAQFGHKTRSLIIGLPPVGELLPEFRKAFDHVHLEPRRFETARNYLKRIIALIHDYNPDVIINNIVHYMQACYPYLPDTMVKLSVIHSISPREITICTAHDAHVDSVIAVSENIKKAALQLGRAGKIIVLPVGIHIEDSVGTASADNTKIKLTYLGRLTKDSSKNLFSFEKITDYLLNERIPFELLFIGDGDARSSLEERFNQKEYFKDVIFSGAVAPDKVKLLLHGRDIFLLPSTFEGTPHALLEAMSFGLVPIVSRLKGSTDQIITDCKSGFLCQLPMEPIEYGQYIKKLSEDRDGLKNMSDAARRAMDKYSIETIGKAYLDLIESSLKTERNLTAGVEQIRRITDIPRELSQYWPGMARHTASLLLRKVRY